MPGTCDSTEKAVKAIHDTFESICPKIDELLALEHESLRILRHERVHKRWVRFAYFFTIQGDTIVTTITTKDCTKTQAFSLIGATPAGDTFVEPTVAVTPEAAGTVVLQPSVQGENGAFTTAGLFTAAAGYLGPVELSAEVQGIDDEDVTFNVVAAPETVAFDPNGFVAT